MLATIIRFFWGNITHEEIKKFSLLTITFFSIIGSYWVIRLLKKVILEGTISYDMQPRAKIISLFVVIGLVFIYSKLIDMFSRHTLFYILFPAYAFGLIAIAYCVAHPTIGLSNTVRSPYRILGWFTYILAESYGSICPQFFWSFVISISTSESAKRGFPMIVAGAQIGAIAGSLLVMNVHAFGITHLILFAALCMLLVPLLIYYFMRVTDTSTESHHESDQPKTGMLEGLRLIGAKPYLIGILGVSTLYEVIGTIIEFQMDKLAIISTGSATGYAEFSGFFGFLTNGLSFLFSLLGTSWLLRHLGVSSCLLLFPLLTGAAIIVAFFFPTLWFVVGAVVVLKGLSYGLNNPTKEMMYIPTSKDIKFKAKGWIDGFGGRTAKATGSTITDGLRIVTSSFETLISYGSFISIGIVGLWIGIATYAGRTYTTLIKENKTIE